MKSLRLVLSGRNAYTIPRLTTQINLDEQKQKKKSNFRNRDFSIRKGLSGLWLFARRWHNWVLQRTFLGSVNYHYSFRKNSHGAKQLFSHHSLVRSREHCSIYVGISLIERSKKHWFLELERILKGSPFILYEGKFL